jgi:hypothetical protein
MAIASAMYHSGKNPLKNVHRKGGDVVTPKGDRARRLHKAFLRYHDAANWPLLREALKRMGREDLIGNGKHHLVPSWQPRDSGVTKEGGRVERKGEQCKGESHPGKPRKGEPRRGEPRKGEPRKGEPRKGEPRKGEPRQPPAKQRPTVKRPAKGKPRQGR